jgi:hypothetical protein
MDCAIFSDVLLDSTGGNVNVEGFGTMTDENRNILQETSNQKPAEHTSFFSSDLDNSEQLYIHEGGNYIV